MSSRSRGVTNVRFSRSMIERVRPARATETQRLELRRNGDRLFDPCDSGDVRIDERSRERERVDAGIDLSREAGQERQHGGGGDKQEKGGCRQIPDQEIKQRNEDEGRDRPPGIHSSAGHRCFGRLVYLRGAHWISIHNCDCGEAAVGT